MNFLSTLILFLVHQTLRSYCVNYERFEVDEECSKEEAGVEVTSTTECLLHCSMGKCMNSLITQNQTCFCTDEECSPLKEQSRSRKTYFFSSPLTKASVEPICYQAKSNSFATFNVPLTGHIKYFKLVHVSGYISCIYEDGISRWGCRNMKPDVILTAITDVNNEIIAPKGPALLNGRYQVAGVNHRTDNDLILLPNSTLEVQQNQEFRVWYTEDLMDHTEHDNQGIHCINVLIKYC